MTAGTTGVKIAGTTYVTASVIQSVRIDYGRRSPAEHCQPSTATVTLLNGFSASLDLGVELVVEQTIAGTTYTRFRGLIDSYDSGPWTTTVVAISSPMRILGAAYASNGMTTGGYSGVTQSMFMETAAMELPSNTSIDGESFLINTYAADTSTFDTGRYPYPSSYDPLTGVGDWNGYAGSVMDLLHEIADMDGAAYWCESVDGTELIAVDGRYRSTTSAFPLLASDVYRDWQITKSKDHLTNAAEISYIVSNSSLPIENWGTVATYKTKEPASIAAYGASPITVSTAYADAGTAQRSALIKMAGRTAPRAILNSLRVDVRKAGATVTTGLMTAFCGTRISTTSLTTAIPGCPSAMYLEGWTETITNTLHDMELYLSDVLLTQPLEQWQQVAPALTYAAVSGTLKWFDLLTTTI